MTELNTHFFHNSRGDKVGWITTDKDGKKVFRKRVMGSKHLLKVMDAWGIDLQIVMELGKFKCEELRIRDEETNIVYVVTYQKFCDTAVERNFVGAQLFLPRRYWEKVEPVEK